MKPPEEWQAPAEAPVDTQQEDRETKETAPATRSTPRILADVLLFMLRDAVKALGIPDATLPNVVPNAARAAAGHTPPSSSARPNSRWTRTPATATC